MIKIKFVIEMADIVLAQEHKKVIINFQKQFYKN